MAKTSTIVIRVSEDDRRWFEKGARNRPVSEWAREVLVREAKDLAGLSQALLVIDWGQVVRNGGPPCFHVEAGRFCLRAERWDGHGVDHAYVPLDGILRRVSATSAV